MSRSNLHAGRKYLEVFDVLRTPFEIDLLTSDASANDVRREVLRWVKNRAGGGLSRKAWSFEPFDVHRPGHHISGVRVLDDDNDIWAIRLEEPDKNVAGRSWVTELVMAETDASQLLCTIRLLVSSNKEQIFYEPASPGILRQLDESFGIKVDNVRCDPSSATIESEQDINQLMQLLEDENRRLPVFVISLPNDRSNALINAAVLSKRAFGIGHTRVLGIAASRILTEKIGSELSVFDGGCRTYFPNFSIDDNRYSHPLSIRSRLESSDDRQKCLNFMVRSATQMSRNSFKLGESVFPFFQIKRSALEKRDRPTTKEDGNEQIATLKKEVASLKEENDYYVAEHDQSERRAQDAEGKNKAYALRIQKLEEILSKPSEHEVPAPSLPSSWSEFAEWCEDRFLGKIVLLPGAERSIKKAKFKDIELTAKCIQWLATDYRESKLKGGGHMQDVTVTNGVTNTQSGGDAFEVNWQGQTRTADWHIKNGGNTRDPERCLRIYYFWDEETQQVVVASLPGHIRSQRS